MPTGIKKRYVVAVSGGIDSVVLLDAVMMGRTIAGVTLEALRRNHEIIVAHFDHGIREESAADEAFVRDIARRYECRYYSRREVLGKNASEDTARRRRYAFLHDICRKNDATLVTAHHADDVAETAAINVVRGTGWRGVAVMDNQHIVRPLLDVTKAEIRAYAATYGLKWREDSTNNDTTYLRNRLRKKNIDPDVVRQIGALRARQIELKRMIDEEVATFVEHPPYSRYFFTHCGDLVASELVRAVVMRETGCSTTLSARTRMLHAIKTARAGTVTPVAAGVGLRFTKGDFVVDTRVKVV